MPNANHLRISQDPQALRERKEMEAIMRGMEAMIADLRGPGATPEQERDWRERLAKAPPITDERVRRMLGL